MCNYMWNKVIDYRRFGVCKLWCGRPLERVSNLFRFTCYHQVLFEADQDYMNCFSVNFFIDLNTIIRRRRWSEAVIDRRRSLNVVRSWVCQFTFVKGRWTIIVKRLLSILSKLLRCITLVASWGDIIFNLLWGVSPKMFPWFTVCCCVVPCKGGR